MKSYIVFPSSKWLYVIGLLAAFFSPLIGLIMGIYFLRHPQVAKEGKIITIFAIIWLGVVFYLTVI